MGNRNHFFQNKGNLKKVSITLTAVIVIAVIVFVVFFRGNIGKFTMENEKNLALVSGRGFSEAVTEQLSVLEGLADAFSDRDGFAAADIREELLKFENTFSFRSIGFVDPEGTVYVTGKENAAITDMPLYETAMNGEPVLSEELFDVGDGEKAIIAAVPVYDGGKIVGVMLGFLPEEALSTLVGQVVLPDDRVIVFDNSYNIIGKSDNEVLISLKNKFDYYTRQFHFKDKISAQDVKDLVKKGEALQCRINFNEEDLLMTLEPLSINHWNLVRLSPTKTVFSVRNTLVTGATILGILMLFILLVMNYLIYVSGMAVIELKEVNAKYSLLDNESKTVTFSYNPNSRAVELNGAVEQTLGPEIAKTGTINLVSFLDLLHETDQGLSKNISKAVAEGQNKYSTELRIRNEEGDYHWFKLEAVIIKNGSDTIEKIIGSLKNTEDQINKEHVLKNKAERDLLTGLLNKITMQNTVAKALEEKPNGTFAFYIIDLDNFKAVNDNLGHAIGDKVLTDVANKLTLLFNEFDFIGRLGGDEFAVMLVIPENMSNYADRLMEVKAKGLCDNLKEIYTSDDISVTVSASIGIAVYSTDGKSFEELYEHADRALYHSKNSGKNQFTFYSEELG